LPTNVLEGVVTLERVRGWVQMFAPRASTDLEQALVHPIILDMQLAPSQAGALVLASILNNSNSADLESNRFIGRWCMSPSGWNSDGLTMTIGGNAGILVTQEIDVRVRRRFDISCWSLLLGTTIDIANVVEAGWLFSAQLRALFRVSDAV